METPRIAHRVTPRTLLLLFSAGVGCSHRDNTPLSVRVPRVTEAPRANANAPLVTVRAREAPRMPNCTADPPLLVGDATVGLSATPVIATNTHGAALIAWVARHDGRNAMMLLPIAADGTPGTAHPLPAAMESPEAPAIAAQGNGFVLAWRAGPANARGVYLRALDEHGVPTGDVQHPNLPPGWPGAPAVTLAPDGLWLAVAHSSVHPADPEAPEMDAVQVVDPRGGVRETPAPAGGAFDAAPPVMVSTLTGVRVFATVARRGSVPGDERALVRLPDVSGASPILIARDLDHPAALPIPTGTLLAWRARVALHDTAARILPLGASDEISAPPWTVATWRGAYDAAVALVPMGDTVDPDARIGVLTASTLSDDTDGSINVSLVTASGTYVGRAPIVTGYTARSARLAVAGAGRSAMWAVADARGPQGPAVALVRVRCAMDNPMDRLDVPPPTRVQAVADAEVPAVTLADAGSARMTCTSVASGDLAVHHSATHDPMAGTSSAVVAFSGGRALAFAVVQLQTESPPVLVTRVLGPPVGPVVHQGPAVAILSAEAVAGSALAVLEAPGTGDTHAALLTVSPTGVAHRVVLPTVLHPTSAAVQPTTGMAYVSAKSSHGDVSLYQVDRTGRARVVARLRPGDEVLDTVYDGHDTRVLLGRADELGDAVAGAVASVTLPDGGAGATGDAFADPVGFMRGTTAWGRDAEGWTVLSSEGAVLRSGELTAAGLTGGQSVLGVYDEGGRMLSAAWGGALRWVAVATGTPAGTEMHGAVTVTAMGPDGRVRGVSEIMGADRSAVADGMALAAGVPDGLGTVELGVTYADMAATGMVWRWAQVRCRVPGGGR